MKLLLLGGKLNEESWFLCKLESSFSWRRVERIEVFGTYEIQERDNRAVIIKELDWLVSV